MESEAGVPVGQASSEQPVGQTPDRQPAALAPAGGSPSGGSRRDPRTPLSGAAPAAKSAGGAAGTAGGTGLAQTTGGTGAAGAAGAGSPAKVAGAGAERPLPPETPGGAPTVAWPLPFDSKHREELMERGVLPEQQHSIEACVAATLCVLLEARARGEKLQTLDLAGEVQQKSIGIRSDLIVHARRLLTSNRLLNSWRERNNPNKPAYWWLPSSKLAVAAGLVEQAAAAGRVPQHIAQQAAAAAAAAVADQGWDSEEEPGSDGEDEEQGEAERRQRRQRRRRPVLQEEEEESEEEEDRQRGEAEPAWRIHLSAPVRLGLLRDGFTMTQHQDRVQLYLALMLRALLKEPSSGGLRTEELDAAAAGVIRRGDMHTQGICKWAREALQDQGLVVSSSQPGAGDPNASLWSVPEAKQQEAAAIVAAAVAAKKLPAETAAAPHKRQRTSGPSTHAGPLVAAAEGRRAKHKKKRAPAAGSGAAAAAAAAAAAGASERRTQQEQRQPAQQQQAPVVHRRHHHVGQQQAPAAAHTAATAGVRTPVAGTVRAAGTAGGEQRAAAGPVPAPAAAARAPAPAPVAAAAARMPQPPGAARGPAPVPEDPAVPWVAAQLDGPSIGAMPLAQALMHLAEWAGLSPAQSADFGVAFVGLAPASRRLWYKLLRKAAEQQDAALVWKLTVGDGAPQGGGTA